MEVIHYFDSDRQEHWREAIRRSDWNAGPFLAQLLRDGTFFDAVGAHSQVLLLTDGDALISYCTYAEKDDIQPTELTPWVGFVYTFPKHRGNRYAGLLFAEVERLARAEGVHEVFLSTNHTGLYEKYGFTYQTTLTDLDGNPSRVYSKRTDPARENMNNPYCAFAKQCSANRVYPLSIAQGFQDGNIFIDANKGVRAVLFWHYAGFAYLSGEITEALLDRIYRNYLLAERNRRFVLITGDTAAVRFFADKPGITIERRVEYRYDKAPPETIGTCGYRIEAISDANLQKIRGRIIPSFAWSSEKQFLKNGFGYVAMDGDTVAAVAFSASVSTEEVDIGVETAEPYRRKGLAKALVDRMCRDIVSMGKKPVWAHAASNTGSMQTALSAGFSVDRINTVIKTDFL